ncbi:hypothetical protein CMV30_17925 [Nibricoccus aquaticus]|uniref:YCII-related domain-containing protein n=1 Tax=Nibricoccus aquaticus TaxID=2576891 RepID=A0A290QB48_9BACT|nr:YciI family protein [Nibricoccus aquaticus]ATC65673.1 hypothetical protein CMV30_17925 [Nibricoccus aquaticus]
MATTAVPFMLIFRESPEYYSGMSEDKRRQILSTWNAWYDGLARQGKATGGNALDIATSRTVSGPHGERLVDGPYAEAKEAIAGYFMLSVSGMEEATEIARHCPNLAYGMTVEVRPLATACHIAKSLAMDSMREPIRS